MLRRTFLTSSATLVAGVALGTPAKADETPGVTATEIKIGNTMPYSGPASSYGVVGRTEAAFFKMINDQGGIAGRRLTFISLDDGFSPPKTVEQTRKLVEETGVAFLFSGVGTAANTAVQKYLNDRGIPQLFVATGADKWGNYSQFPWTIGFQPSYRTEARIYAKYILAHKPDARIGILYQNDDSGKDYVLGVRDVLGEKFDQMVTKSVSYEVADTTIDFANRFLAIGWGRHFHSRGPCEVRCAGNSQVVRRRLEALILPKQRIGIGRHGYQSDRAGEGGRHHYRQLRDGRH